MGEAGKDAECERQEKAGEGAEYDDDNKFKDGTNNIVLRVAWENAECDGSVRYQVWAEYMVRGMAGKDAEYDMDKMKPPKPPHG